MKQSQNMSVWLEENGFSSRFVVACKKVQQISAPAEKKRV
jgi:hypothetical protein